MKHIIILSVILLIALSGCREEIIQKPFEVTHAQGAVLMSDADYAQVPDCTLPDLSFKKEETRPASFALPMPPAGDQGCMESCVAWAAGYGIMSYYIANERQNFNYDNSILRSPIFLYSQAYLWGDCVGGSSVFSNPVSRRGVLDILQDKGICSLGEMAYPFGTEVYNAQGKYCNIDETTCATQPDNTQLAQASAYKIRNFERIWLRGGDINYLKGLLLQGYPILFAMNTKSDFQRLGTSVLNATTNTGTNMGGHAMVVMGYDDSKHAFKVLNSWGQSFGDQGMFWFDYDYFAQQEIHEFVLYYDAANISLYDNSINWETPLNSYTCTSGNTGSGNYITIKYSKTTFNPNAEDFTVNESYTFPNGSSGQNTWVKGQSGLQVNIADGTLTVWLCTTFNGNPYLTENFNITTTAGRTSNTYTFVKTAPAGAFKTTGAGSQSN